MRNNICCFFILRKVCLSIVVVGVLFLLFSLFTSPANAQVVINEVYTMGGSSGDPDWVELYNFSQTEIDLQGWLIKHVTGSANEAVAHEFTESDTIPAEGFFVQDVSNRLNNKGDRILLFQGDTQKDCMAYGDGHGESCGEERVCTPLETQTIGRYPDSNSTIVRFSASTKGTNNEASFASCPTPTPTPSDTPIPTLKPTNTPVPTNTSKPTLTPTKVPTRAIADNREVGDVEEVGAVLSEKRDELAEEDSDKKEGGEESRGDIPLAAGAFVIAGIGFMLAAFYPFLKKRLRVYNLKDNDNKKDSEQIL